MVEKGVNERVRLHQIYEKKTEELEKQHEEIRQHFYDLENKVSLLWRKSLQVDCW